MDDAMKAVWGFVLQGDHVAAVSLFFFGENTLFAINCANKEQFVALHTAASRNLVGVVKVLLAHP